MEQGRCPRRKSRAVSAPDSLQCSCSSSRATWRRSAQRKATSCTSGFRRLERLAPRLASFARNYDSRAVAHTLARVARLEPSQRRGTRDANSIEPARRRVRILRVTQLQFGGYLLEVGGAASY